MKTNEKSAPEFKLVTLGDYLGATGRYFGRCACCGHQFHGQSERLALTNVGRVCERCTTKPGLTYTVGYPSRTTVVQPA